VTAFKIAQAWPVNPLLPKAVRAYLLGPSIYLSTAISTASDGDTHLSHLEILANFTTNSTTDYFALWLSIS
jgi:hypothetical protein